MRKAIDHGLSAQTARVLIGAIIDQVIADRLNPSLIIQRPRCRRRAWL
jgi:hypothetical protein